MRLMALGASNRKVGETLLNKESSRSHSVFTCFIEKTVKSDNGVANVITSRLNIIDLAGAHGQQGTLSQLAGCQVCCHWSELRAIAGLLGPDGFWGRQVLGLHGCHGYAAQQLPE
jgi:hypothetical protein